MERKQVQFTRRQAAAIRREARRRNVSDAAIVREAIDRWMAKPATSVRTARVRRALAVVGGFRSGTRITAREHDRALTDTYRR